MAKRTINAKQFLGDFKAGANDAALMEKYQISAQGLQGLFRKLMEAGAIKQSDLDGRPAISERTSDVSFKCPACGKPQARQDDVCPVCGVTFSKVTAKQESTRARTAATGTEKETFERVDSTQPPTLPQAPLVEPEKKHVLPLRSPGPIANRFKEFLWTRKVYIAVASIGILVVAVVLLWPQRLNPTLTKRLIEVSAAGHVPTVKLLLDKGADINAKDEEGMTALMLASVLGHADVVKLLLDKGADTTAKSVKEGMTALMGASGSGHFDVVRMLLKKGDDINARSKNGVTALMFASSAGHADVAKLLLDRGADINAKDAMDGFTALAHASDKGHASVVKLLLDKGADTTAKDSLFGRTALMLASSAGHADVAKLLLEKGADINAKGEKGITALVWAAAAGHADIVELLLDKGADINVKGEKGMTALILASSRGHQEVVDVLKAHGAKE